MPKEGISRREYRTKKFGSWERSQELDAKVVAVGKEDGIDFAFDRIEQTPNTLDAHRLIWLAEVEGVQDAVVETLFRAYFIEGQDISDRQTLLDVVAKAGLDRGKAEAMLKGNDGPEAIKEAGDLSRRHHVDGVPFFVIDGKITLAGAQPPEAFLAAFGQAGEQWTAIRGSPSAHRWQDGTFANTDLALARRTDLKSSQNGINVDRHCRLEAQFDLRLADLLTDGHSIPQSSRRAASRKSLRTAAEMPLTG